jgi:hypothetical protein
MTFWRVLKRLFVLLSRWVRVVLFNLNLSPSEVPASDDKNFGAAHTPLAIPTIRDI